MRKSSLAGCLVVLVISAGPASATFVNTRVPVPELVGGADTIVVGKVARIEKKLLTALPTRNAAKKEHYQIVEVTIGEALRGAKGLTSIKIGVQCFEANFGRGPRKFAPTVPWTEGQEACFFLKRHFSGKFYELGIDTFLRKELNGDFSKDLDLTRKCVNLLKAPEDGLNSRKVEDRVLTATLLIRKYRGPAPSLFGQPASGKKHPKQEPIAAEESKLILHALAEADWSLAKEPSPSVIHPVSMFRRLGLTAKDGWKLKQRPVSPLDGRAGYQAHLEFTRAAKRWLKVHADTYRIKRIVDAKTAKTETADEKADRAADKQLEQERKDKEKADAAKRQKDKAGDKSLRAAAKLKLIKSLLDAGKTDIGKFRLEQLIKEYPDTPAADEARKLLKEKE